MAIKPVELEILIKGDDDLKAAAKDTDALTKAAKAYSEELQTFNASAEDMQRLMTAVRGVLADVGKACEGQEASMAALRAEYDRLNAEAEKAAAAGQEETAASRQRAAEIKGELTVRQSLVQSLRESSAELDSAVQAQEKETREVKQSEQQHESLRQKIRALKQEMADARMNGIDEQSEAYKRLAAELGRLQDVQADITRQGSILSNDQSRFQGIVSGLRGVTAAFTAAQGAMALFGSENEEMAKTMQKLQSLMYITISLQQVSEVLNKDSAFRLVTLTNLKQWWNNLLDIGRAKTVESTAAETAETVAVEAQTAAIQQNTAAKTGNTAAQGANTVAADAGTAANITLAGAFRMVGAAIKSIPVFGWIAAGISALAAAVMYFSSKAKAAKKDAEEFYKAVSEQAYQPIGQLKQLQAAWDDLGDDIQAKEKFIEENKQAFDKLGVSVDNVQDAENLMVTNAQAFIDAQIAKAKATILLQQAMDKEKTLAQLELDTADMSDYSKNWLGMRTWNMKKKANQEQITSLRDELEPLYKQINQYESEAAKTLSNAGIKLNTAAVKAQSQRAAKTRASDTDKEAQEQQRAAQKAADELLALQRQNQQAQLDLMEEGAEKRRAKIEDDYNQQLAQIKAKADELAELNRQAGEKNVDKTTGLTDEQAAALKDAMDDAEEKRQKALDREQLAELQAMTDYLKNYGSFQQQKLAIAEEYDRKIAEADNEWQKKSLEKERQAAILQVDVNAAKQNIDWQSVMGDLGGISRAALEETLENLKTIAGSSEFQGLTLDDKQKVYDLISDIESILTRPLQECFNELGTALARYREELNAYNDAVAKAQQAAEDLKEKEDALADALANGWDTQGLQEAVDQARQAYNESKEAAENHAGSLKDAKEDVDKAAKEIKNNFDLLGESISGLKSGSLTGTLKGIKDLGQFLSNLGGKLGDFGEKLGNIDPTGILESILGVIDLIKDGLGDLFANLIDMVMDAVNGIISDIFSGDIIMKPVKSVVSGVGNLLNTITFGALTARETDKKLTDDMESLSYSNDALKNSIDALKDAITDNTKSVTDQAAALEQARANLAQEEADTQSIMQRAGKNHKSGLFGSDYSSNHYVNKNMTADDWKAVSDAAGVAVSSASDFWTLTSEQMYNVSIQAAAQYAKIKEYADDGHSDVSQYMDDYISYYTQLNELNEEWVEQLTSLTFDDLRSNFLSALMDMDSDAQTFADDFSEYLQQAMLNYAVSDLLNEPLKAWYDELARHMENNNGYLDESDIQSLLSSWEDIVDQGLQLRDSIAQVTGYTGDTDSSTSQTGNSKGFQALTQDQGTKLEGMFTAGLIHWSAIDTNLELVLDRMTMAESHLAKIEDNTGSSAASLLEIAENVLKMVRDGIKVK